MKINQKYSKNIIFANDSVLCRLTKGKISIDIANRPLKKTVPLCDSIHVFEDVVYWYMGRKVYRNNHLIYAAPDGFKIGSLTFEIGLVLIYSTDNFPLIRADVPMDHLITTYEWKIFHGKIRRYKSCFGNCELVEPIFTTHIKKNTRWSRYYK